MAKCRPTCKFLPFVGEQETLSDVCISTYQKTMLYCINKLEQPQVGSAAMLLLYSPHACIHIEAKVYNFPWCWLIFPSQLVFIVNQKSCHYVVPGLFHRKQKIFLMFGSIWGKLTFQVENPLDPKLDSLSTDTAWLAVWFQHLKFFVHFSQRGKQFLVPII